MTDWTPYTARAKEWFESLRDSICSEFEAIEREAGSDASFDYTPWQRAAVEGEGGEGGGFALRGVGVRFGHADNSSGLGSKMNGVG